MKRVIKAVKILCGIGLFTVGIGGGVGLCLSSPIAFKQMIVSGTPVSCPIHGTELKVPGRLFAAAVIGVPISALLGGWWVLRSAFDDGDQSKA